MAGKGREVVTTADNPRYRVDFVHSAPGWVTAIVKDTKTGQMAQATAGDHAKAESAAKYKLRKL